MRILIADDEIGITGLLQDLLIERGYEVDIADDGERAFNLIQANDYAFVFLDHNMPGRTGLEIVKWMKKEKKGAKVVMVTGYPNMKDFFAKALGADYYVNKPFQFEQILTILQDTGHRTQDTDQS